MKKYTWLLPLIWACTDPPAEISQPIINGEFEPERPAVVGLADGFGVFCTGTLVSRRVVLTAGHCTDPDVTLIDPSNYLVFFGPDAKRGDGLLYPTADVIKNPNFSIATLRNDIGAVVLDRDAPVEPIGFRTAPFDDSIFSQPLTFVGYGLDSPFSRRSGLKQKTENFVFDYNDTQLFYDGTQTNTCFGDSGGPALQRLSNGDEQVVGVTSFGDTACASFGADTRVDAFFLNFLQPILDAEAPAEVGCTLDDSCNPDCVSPDPDCDLTDCDGGNVCNHACPELDPDCEDPSCDQDGICDTRCADRTQDLDCVCAPDNVCAAGCGDLDTDCEKGCQVAPSQSSVGRFASLFFFLSLLLLWRSSRRLC